MAKKSSSFDKGFKSKIEASKKRVMGKKKETGHVDMEKVTDESTIIFDGVLSRIPHIKRKNHLTKPP